jgi:16S rRNA pseudouridine516 synthase
MSPAELLFTQGFGTRRDCARLLTAGRLSCDGRVLKRDDTLDVAEGRLFEVDGQPWPYHASALVLLHKPAGFECSLKPRHHPSVLTLLPPPLRTRGVQPVGRLDEDTTGLLLLTDDGGLIHRLTSPKHHVPKVYEVRCKHPHAPEQLQRLREGVVLDDDPRPVRAAAVEAVDAHVLALTLTEGKYHQVKRMLAAVGNRVQALHRSTFGALVLDATLAPGQWRWVSAAERAALITRPEPTLPVSPATASPA